MSARGGGGGGGGGVTTFNGRSGAVTPTNGDYSAAQVGALPQASYVKGIYGDGSDSAVTLGAGTTLLSRDMYYTSLVVPNGATLVTGGFVVFANASITIQAGGIVDCNNFNTVGSGASGGGGGGSQSAGSCSNGGTGTAGGTTTGGSSGTFNNGIGGSGGGGGAGSSAGGTVGSNSGPLLRDGGFRHVPAVIHGHIPTWNSTNLVLNPGQGGTGGGGDGTHKGGGGGAGGCWGTLVSPNIINSGSILCNGQTGGAGDPAGNTGGGGGGGGGICVTICETFSGTAPNVSGGSGGAPGGTGVAGSSGGNGIWINIPG